MSTFESRIIFGTLRLHETEKPYELLDEALRLGIKAFDTARVYGNGDCERILGEWLRGASSNELHYNEALGARRRREVTIITKGGCGDGSTFWRPNLEYSSLRTELDQSLKQLGLESIPFYILHRDDTSKSIDEICQTMQSFIDQGLIGAWGVSNWQCHRLSEVLQYTKMNGLTPPCCSSLQDSLASPLREPWPGTVFMNDEERAFYMHHTELAVLAWETLGKGFLAGRWHRHDTLSPADVNNSADSMTDVYSDEWRENRLKGAYLHPENFDRRERATTLAKAKGNNYKSEHVAIAWILAQGYQGYVIIATVNPDHLRSNIDALSLELTPQDVEWLNTGNLLTTKKASKRPLLVPKIEIATSKRDNLKQTPAR